jgi:hypothetical protein
VTFPLAGTCPVGCKIAVDVTLKMTSLPFGTGMEARRAGVVVVTAVRVVVVVECIDFGFEVPETAANVAAATITHAATPLPIAT